MLRNVTPARKKRQISLAAFRRFSFGALAVGCLILILSRSDTAMIHMSQGLLLCATTVIPSLFPFMVLSELLVATGCGTLLGRLFERPMRRLFGISGAGACALIMGLICGFPVGTKTAVSLCRHGKITVGELSRLICFCNIPSPAFLINVIGVSLFASRRFGILLYGICLAAALLTALLLQCIRPLASEQPSAFAESVPPQIGLFTHAVTSAATAMLYVCAYVVFFTALVGTLGELLGHFYPNQTLIATLFGFFELSGGVVQAAMIHNAPLARWITAFLCGWSGLSVHLQILSLCDNLPDKDTIHPQPYFLCKLFQGLLCALLCGLFLYFLPSSRLSVVDPPIISVLPTVTSAEFAVIYNGMLLFFPTIAAVRYFRPKHKKDQSPKPRTDLSALILLSAWILCALYANGSLRW